MYSEKRADFRREFLGFVFQSFYLVSYLTVLENAMLPLTTTGLGKKIKRDMAQEALAWVGLDQKVHRMPNQISGREKERVAIARAIVNDPLQMVCWCMIQIPCILILQRWFHLLWGQMH
jgi:putative ABC transport system ATP-binding protein